MTSVQANAQLPSEIELSRKSITNTRRLDIMEDYEIGIALRKEMELRELSERYPALNPQLYTPWALGDHGKLIRSHRDIQSPHHSVFD